MAKLTVAGTASELHRIPFSLSYTEVVTKNHNQLLK
jgi:hypothetical protein